MLPELCAYPEPAMMLKMRGCSSYFLQAGYWHLQRVQQPVDSVLLLDLGARWCARYKKLRGLRRGRGFTGLAAVDRVG